MMKTAEASILEHMRKLVLHVLPSEAHAWFYGSRARGEAYDGSDWDVLILIDKAHANSFWHEFE